MYTPPSGPPQVEPPRDLYAQMGEQNIFRMSEDFYQRLGESAIADMFPTDLVAASRKQAAFLVGILGGPPLYQQRYGPPRMRARHFPFAIDEAARNEWLRCFRETLDEPNQYALSRKSADRLLDFLEVFSGWMVNRAG